MELVDIGSFKKELFQAEYVAAFCGAGVSLNAPTSLPAGNALRDLTVCSLLKDRQNAYLIERLLAAESYRALLPEAALQEIGYYIQPHVDRFISRLLSNAPPNALHVAISETFKAIFTTNFDNCFELCGARQVYHVHGSATDPESMQHQLWRVGHTAENQLARLKDWVQAKPIFVTGYSMRDYDVVRVFASANNLTLYYLSHTGELPTVLDSLPGRIICAQGALEEVLSVRRIYGNRVLAIPRIRRPPIQQKGMALLYLCNAAGMVEAVKEAYALYYPRLTGRYRLRSTALLAETLREAQQFAMALSLAKQAMKSRLFNNDKHLDTLSYLMTIAALCEQEGFANLAKARRSLLGALKYINKYLLVDHSPDTPVRVAVWRAKLANNLANVERDRGRHRRAEVLYRYSIRVKSNYGEEGGMAISLSNLSVLQITMRNLPAAAKSLQLAASVIEKSPDLYVLRTAIFDNAIALAHLTHSSKSRISFGNVDVLALKTELVQAPEYDLGLNSIISALQKFDGMLTKLTEGGAL